MRTAVVKWWNDLANYGFLTTDDGQDIFVHRNGLKDVRTYPALLTADKVRFEIEEYRGKPTAVAVELIEDEDEEED